MSNPLISVIIPVYNGEKYLGETIESILAQTYEPTEIIIVNDGSTDGTQPIAEDLAAKHDNVTAVHQDNAGPVVARNTGLEHATGTYISFLDSDDLWEPNKLEIQYAKFAADPDLGYCVSYMQNFWMPELAEEAEKMKDHPRAQPMPGYVTQSLLTTREVFDKVGRFNPELGHGDATDWFMRADQAGVKKLLLDDVLVRRRVHPDSLSRNQAAASREEFLKLVKASLDRKRGG